MFGQIFGTLGPIKKDESNEALQLKYLKKISESSGFMSGVLKLVVLYKVLLWIGILSSTDFAMIINQIN